MEKSRRNCHFEPNFLSLEGRGEGERRSNLGGEAQEPWPRGKKVIVIAVSRSPESKLRPEGVAISRATCNEAGFKKKVYWGNVFKKLKSGGVDSR